MSTENKEVKKNYSEVQERELIKIGKACKTFGDFKNQAEKLAKTELFDGKNSRQILSKFQQLARSTNEFVYVKKVYAPKVAGTTVVSKAELIEELSTLIGVESEMLESLAAAKKSVLITLIARFKDFKNKILELESTEWDIEE